MHLIPPRRILPIIVIIPQSNTINNTKKDSIQALTISCTTCGALGRASFKGFVIQVYGETFFGDYQPWQTPEDQ